MSGATFLSKLNPDIVGTDTPSIARNARENNKLDVIKTHKLLLRKMCVYTLGHFGKSMVIHKNRHIKIGILT
ncbi:MAG: hypothetical protein QXP36_12775 [Conexivisphaerales archaeon]